MQKRKILRSAAVILLLVCCVQAKAQHVHLEWAKSMGESNPNIGLDCGLAVAADGAGNVYVTGRFEGAVDFDPGPGTAILTAVASTGSVATTDVFLAKYDPNGNYLWAKSMGNTGNDFGYGLKVVDVTGHVYVTGGFYGTVDFDPGPGIAPRVSNGGNADVFVAKYDLDGNYVWAINMGGGGSSDFEYGYGVTVDAAHNVYVAGVFNVAAADFDPGPGTAILTRVGTADAFIAKYDSSGNYLWAKGIGGSGQDYALTIDLDTAGNVYVGGYFQNSVDFDPGLGVNTLASSGGQDAFVAKYDPYGNYLWAIKMGGSSAEIAYGIVVDAIGSVYVTGLFNSASADFDPGSGTKILNNAMSGRIDGYVAKYDSSGNYLWAGSTGSTSTTADGGWSLALDAVGNLYVTGAFTGSADFDFGTGTAVLTAAGGNDVFVAKYAPNGSYLWAKSMGGAGADIGRGIALDGRGNMYVTGIFNSATADFDPGPDTVTLTGAGGDDIFIVKLACDDTASTHLTAEIACGDEYTLNGKVYTASGIYTQHFPKVTGCDSVVVLALAVLAIDQPVITVDTFVLSVTGTYAAYQWIKNGTDIPGATDSTYTVTENADYQVRAANEYGCEDTSAVYKVTNVLIDEAKGIEQYISIYPNPAHEIIYINSPVSVQARLYSIEGRSVLHMENAKTVAVSGLARGLYLLRIMDKDGRLIKVEKVEIE